MATCAVFPGASAPPLPTFATPQSHFPAHRRNFKPPSPFTTTTSPPPAQPPSKPSSTPIPHNLSRPIPKHSATSFPDREIALGGQPSARCAVSGEWAAALGSRRMQGVFGGRSRGGGCGVGDWWGWTGEKGRVWRKEEGRCFGRWAGMGLMA